MQQVRLSVGNICRTTRRHTAEVVTFSNIPTAHILMRLYLGWIAHSGQFRDRIPVEARSSAFVNVVHGAHTTFREMGTGSLSRGQIIRDVALTNYKLQRES
jgi:hypothetical protein